MRDHIVNILKFLFAILLVPVTVIATYQFNLALCSLPKDLQHWFWIGLSAYLIIHLFIFEPQGVYQFGQKLMEDFFHFSEGAAIVLSRVVPIYTMLSLAFLFSTRFFPSLERYVIYGMFFCSFTLSLHLIFTAKHLGENEESFVRPQYFLSSQLIYLLNLGLIVLVFSLVFDKFSGLDFFHAFTKQTKEFYVAVYRQLFIP